MDFSNSKLEDFSKSVQCKVNGGKKLHSNYSEKVSPSLNPVMLPLAGPLSAAVTSMGSPSASLEATHISSGVSSGVVSTIVSNTSAGSILKGDPGAENSNNPGDPRSTRRYP